MYYVRALDRLDDKYKDYAVLSLRLALGIIFTYHGYLKLISLSGTAQFVGSLGFPAPLFFGIVLTAVELLGGIALIIGFLTRWAAVLLLIDMLTAFFLVHLKNGFLINGVGVEFVLALIGGLITLKLLGPQKLSIDHVLKR